MHNKQIIRLTESELHNIIKESVEYILQEEMMNEKFGDGLRNFASNVKTAYKGGKQALKAKKNVDRGTDNFIQSQAIENLRSQENPFVKGYENTAAEEARETYQLYKQYQQQANALLNKYKKLIKEYDLEKTAPGQVKSKPIEKPAYNNATTRMDNKEKYNGDYNFNFRQKFRDRHSGIYDQPFMTMRGGGRGY